MINYTPVNIDTYSNKNQAVPQHKNGLNFILLLIALITAIAFAVLLFVMIKNKNEEKIIIPSETPAQNINKEVTTIPEKIIPTEILPTDSAISPTLTPQETLTPQVTLGPQKMGESP